MQHMFGVVVVVVVVVEVGEHCTFFICLPLQLLFVRWHKNRAIFLPPEF